MANPVSPRDLVGDGATAPGMPMPPTKIREQGKRKPRSNVPKPTTRIPPLPRAIPKPKVPNRMKPLSPMGGDVGSANPSMVPRNSTKGVRQRISLDVPGIKT